MGSSSRVLFLATAQLCIPAAIYLLVGLYNGRSSGIEHLLPNYLFMAAPHLLVCMLLAWPQFRRPTLLGVLSLLNVVLAVFQLWVLLMVPPNESGLAWLLYMPVWGLMLFACAVAWGIVRYSSLRRVVPAKRVGT